LLGGTPTKEHLFSLSLASSRPFSDRLEEETQPLSLFSPFTETADNLSPSRQSELECVSPHIDPLFFYFISLMKNHILWTWPSSKAFPPPPSSHRMKSRARRQVFFFRNPYRSPWASLLPVHRVSALKGLSRLSHATALPFPTGLLRQSGPKTTPTPISPKRRWNGTPSCDSVKILCLATYTGASALLFLAERNRVAPCTPFEFGYRHPPLLS